MLSKQAVTYGHVLAIKSCTCMPSWNYTSMICKCNFREIILFLSCFCFLKNILTVQLKLNNRSENLNRDLELLKHPDEAYYDAMRFGKLFCIHTVRMKNYSLWSFFIKPHNRESWEHCSKPHNCVWTASIEKWMFSSDSSIMMSRAHKAGVTKFWITVSFLSDLPSPHADQCVEEKTTKELIL